jgi:hypothetical protein
MKNKPTSSHPKRLNNRTRKAMFRTHKSISMFLFIIVVISIFSCSSVRHVKPLEQGSSAASLSVGGPITKVGNIYIPLPLISAGYNYGLIEKLDLETGINVTGLLFGDLHLNAGVNYHPWLAEKLRPGLYLSPEFFFITNLRDGSPRIFPAVDAGLYWDIRRHYLYCGVESWFEVSTIRNDGNPQNDHWLPIPYVGWGIESKRWQFQVEGKIYTPNQKNTGRPTKNIGIGEHGVLGVFIGASRSFRGKK